MPTGNWIIERPSGGGSGGGGLVVGFVINDGTAGNNIGPMLPAPRTGSLGRLVVVTKVSDALDLKFNIRMNDETILEADIVIPANNGAGLLDLFALEPAIPVAVDDVFSIDITQGSVTWKFTVQLE